VKSVSRALDATWSTARTCAPRARSAPRLRGHGAHGSHYRGSWASSDMFPDQARGRWGDRADELEGLFERRRLEGQHVGLQAQTHGRRLDARQDPRRASPRASPRAGLARAPSDDRSRGPAVPLACRGPAPQRPARRLLHPHGGAVEEVVEEEEWAEGEEEEEDEGRGRLELRAEARAGVARVVRKARRRLRPRPRSHCHFAPPHIHFTPDSLRDFVHLFRNNNCDRTLLRPRRCRPAERRPRLKVQRPSGKPARWCQATRAYGTPYNRGSHGR
jgi:hypothetical protein